MTDPFSPTPESAGSPAPERSRAWIAPTVFLLAIVIPVLVLVFSNTETTMVRFGLWEGSAPRWIILLITFVAGALVTRLVGWAWRTMRRRQKQGAAG